MRKIITTSLVLLIAGCTSQQTVSTLNDTARKEADSITSRAQEYFLQASKGNQDKYVHESSEPLLSGRVAPVKRILPSVFGDSYFFNPNGEARLVDALKHLSKDTGILVTARDDVYNPTSTKIESTSENGNIDAAAVNITNQIRTEGNLEVAGRMKLPSGSRYEGSVEGFLDYVSSLLNISWQYLHDENRVIMTRYFERSYALFVPPNDGESGDSDVWGDTETTLKNMLSQGGSVQVSQKTGSISVLDTKDVHQMVAAYVTKINKALQKSVVFNLEVLSVATSDSDSERLDFSFMNGTDDRALGFGGGGISIPSAAGLTASVLSGPFSGTNFIVESLSKQGEVTTSLSRVIKSLSNQTATIRKTDTIPVVEAFNPATTIDGITREGGVELKDIDVGFDLKITPAIMSDGQNLVVRLNLETSNIEDIVDIKIGDDGRFVQSARRTSRQFEHTFPMRNAETIVISGFYDEINNFQQSSTGIGWLSWMFSGKADEATRNHYIILLTPDISNGASVTF